MADHRTAWEQVKSGFWIAGLIVLSFCFFVALVVGLELLMGRTGPSRGHHPVLGAGLTAVLVFLLFKTTKYWARWLVGILGLSVLRFLFALEFKWFYDLPRNLPVREGLVWFAYFLAAFALTVRHASRSPTGAENLGLVSFVVCVALALAASNYVPLLYGLGLLAVAELLQKFVFHRRHHSSPHHVSPSTIGS